MRIGIFGGTFNPIHIGHLILAQTARETLPLDRVLFIPTAAPPHKDPKGLLPGKSRFGLIRLAIKGDRFFEASDIELRRGGVSYTLDTVRLLKRRFAKAQLYLLMGQDMLGVKWRGWDEIKRLCRVVAVGRQDANGGKSALRRQAGVAWLYMPPVGISSSEIRKRVACGRSIRYWVPPAVERSIRANRWYKGVLPC
jgi:nicotinate-nucleotide adenylyltransferase